MAGGKKKKPAVDEDSPVEEPTPKKKQDESEDGPPWKHGGSCRDGKRYTVSVLKDPTRTDMSVYKQFYETESLPDAKEEASDKAMDTGLPVMIFDRRDNWVIHQFDPQKAGEQAEEATTSRKKKK